MSVEQQIASLATKVENINERAKEDRGVLNEIRDLSKETKTKMEGVEKGFADGAAEFAKIRLDLKEHTKELDEVKDRVTDLETFRAEHKGNRGLLNWLLGTLIAAATLAVLAWTAFKMH